MNSELEKLIALHELDLSITRFQAGLDEIAVERKQIEEQLQSISASCGEDTLEVVERMNKLDLLNRQLKENDEQLKKLKSRRQKITNTLPESLVGTYERIKSRNGVALAEASGNCCAKCNIMIRHLLLKRIRKGEHITTCENCGLILYCKQDNISQFVRASA